MCCGVEMIPLAVLHGCLLAGCLLLSQVLGIFRNPTAATNFVRMLQECLLILTGDSMSLPSPLLDDLTSSSLLIIFGFVLDPNV